MDGNIQVEIRGIAQKLFLDSSIKIKNKHAISSAAIT